MNNANDAAAEYESERYEPNDRAAQFREKMRLRAEAAAKQEIGKDVVQETGKEVAQEAPDDRGFIEKTMSNVGSVISDVGEGVLDAPKQIVGGVLDATKELAQTLEAVFPLGTLDGGEVTEDSFIPTTDKSDSVTGNLVRGVSQFVTAFIPVTKVLKGAGMGAGILQSMTAGAMADAGAFDEHEERLSDLIESNPDLSTPVTQYLQSDPNDSMAEGKFKLAIEGLVTGVAGDAFIKIIKVMRARNLEKLGGKRQQIQDKKDLDNLETEDPETLAQVKERLDADNKPGDVSEQNPQGKTKESKPIDDKDPDKYAASINLERLYADDDVIDAISETAERIRTRVDKARRGSMPHAETERLAKELNLTVHDVLNKPPGSIYNAEESLASRKLHLAAQEKAVSLEAKAKESGDRVDRLTALKAREISDNLFEKMAGDASEAGRRLQAQRIIAKVAEPQQQAIKEIISKGGRLSDKVKQSLEDAVTPEQVDAVTKLALKTRKRDAAVEYWYNALLSAPTTHFINTAGNALNVTWNAGSRIVTPAIGKAFGDQETTLKEGVAAVYGMIAGFKDGLEMAGKAIKSSDFNLENTTIERTSASKKAISAETFNATGMSGKAIDYIGSIVRTPGRFLTAGDAFFRSINYRMELQALAYRRATDEGLTGEAAGARMKDIIDNPPEELVNEASQFSKVQTFTNDLGVAGKGLQQAANNFIPLKLLMPFIRTPVNLIKTAARNSVLAPISSTFRADVAAGGARRDRALAQMGMGATLMSVAASMSSEGQITGGGPASTGLKNTLKASGWQPYSLLINGKYYAYNRLDPVGMLIGMAADYTEVSGNAQDLDTDDLAATAALSIFKNLGDKTYLKGINDFFKAYNQISASPDDETRMINRWAGNLLSSAIPNVVTSIKKGTDPNSRATDDSSVFNALVDKVKARTPGFSDELPPLLNVFGDEVFNGGGVWQRVLSPIYTSDKKDDPIADELVRIEVPIDMPNKNIKGVRLTPQEYHDYVKTANDLDGEDISYKEALGQLFEDAEYQQSTVAAQQDAVKKVTFDYRQAAGAIFIENNQEFKLRYEKAMAEKVLAYTGEQE